MTKDEYVDHEVRARLLEKLSSDTNKKLNALIGICLTTIFIPVAMKLLGV